jgi:hypothetical protein
MMQDEKLFLVLSSSVQAGRFQRSKRDQNGNIVQTYEFVRGVPVELTEEIVETVADEIGNILLIGKEQSPGIVKVDGEATDHLLYEIAKAKVEAKAPLTATQQRAIDLFSVGREKPAEPAAATNSEETATSTETTAAAVDSSSTNEADLTEETAPRRGRQKKNP